MGLWDKSLFLWKTVTLILIISQQHFAGTQVRINSEAIQISIKITSFFFDF